MSSIPVVVPDHPAFAYLEIRHELHNWGSSKKVPVKSHALSDELSALRCFEECSDEDDSLLDIGLIDLQDNTDLGTVKEVDLDKIRALASPSSFGKDTETIYDESVRKGLEVPAEKFGFVLDRVLPHEYQELTAKVVFEEIATRIGKELFPGRPVKLVFYKLAMYEAGGHFTRHRDSTHGDAHHGTLLLGCGAKGEATVYEGGNFSLHTGDGSTARYDIRPGTWVAFYTDVEHSVAPVTTGVRLTLQFDIFLEDETPFRPHTVACIHPTSANTELRDQNDENQEEDGLESLRRTRTDEQGQNEAVEEQDNDDGSDTDENETVDEDSDEEDSEGSEGDHEENLLVNLGDYDNEPRSTRSSDAQLTRFVPKFIELIRRVEVRTDAPLTKVPSQAGPKSRPRTAAFLLQHMYRQQSLLPEYLKGIDRALYLALMSAEPTLKIQMHPVYILVINDMSDYSSEQWVQRWKIAGSGVKAKIPSPVVFIPRTGTEYSLMERQDGAEYTGNEAVPEEYKYFAGAMFVYFP